MHAHMRDAQRLWHAAGGKDGLLTREEALARLDGDELRLEHAIAHLRTKHMLDDRAGSNQLRFVLPDSEE